MQQATKMSVRVPQHFATVAAALQAAEENCPTDFLIGKGGDMRHASDFAPTPDIIAGALSRAEFGGHSGDTVCIWIWVPEELEAP